MLTMKQAISELKKTKAILEDQITKLENQKIQLESDLINRQNLQSEKMREIKELLVQILK